MVAKGNSINRKYIGTHTQEVCELPNLVGIQLDSYERFLQLDRIKRGEATDASVGLEAVFQSAFPIESQNGEMCLHYHGYTIDYDNIKFSEFECKRKGRTYSIPIKATISLELTATGELRQREIFFGDFPLMTDRGTFIINGAERVVVSQIHRSPGVIFSDDKGVFSSRIIPYRGSWLEFEIEDKKKELIYAKIDRKKKILGTLFLRAIGFDTREKIIAAFYQPKSVTLDKDPQANNELVGKVVFNDIYSTKGGKSAPKLLRAGDELSPAILEALVKDGVKSLQIIDEEHPNSLHSNIILNCFEVEDAKYTQEGNDEPMKEDVLSPIYAVLQPGEMIAIDRAEKDLPDQFFSSRRYDLGSVGRYKFNKKFATDDEAEEEASTDLTVLTPQDITNTMDFLIKVYIGEENVDDIDHLGNRRVRSVGELLQNQLSAAFARMERIARERMNLESNQAKPQDLISIKPVVAAIKEFFGSSQLSQFMDQVNPLAELTHKRRLNALGPGGLSRDRASFEVRDVHYTHYGRMCPIETPEGPNIGLIVSLANYTRVNKHGFLETPYRRVVDGVVSDDVRYLDANDEEKYFIAQANSPLDKNGNFIEENIPVRRSG
ncbi:MAG: DNA-directed RNA polymerase subunit beta, partial [Sphaerochaetaceae bacterium]